MPTWKVGKIQLQSLQSALIFLLFSILSLSFLFAVCKLHPELSHTLLQLFRKQPITSVLLGHMKEMIERREGQWQVS